MMMTTTTTMMMMMTRHSEQILQHEANLWTMPHWQFIQNQRPMCHTRGSRCVFDVLLSQIRTVPSCCSVRLRVCMEKSPTSQVCPVCVCLPFFSLSLSCLSSVLWCRCTCVQRVLLLRRLVLSCLVWFLFWPAGHKKVRVLQSHLPVSLSRAQRHWLPHSPWTVL